MSRGSFACVPHALPTVCFLVLAWSFVLWVVVECPPGPSFAWWLPCTRFFVGCCPEPSGASTHGNWACLVVSPPLWVPPEFLWSRCHIPSPCLALSVSLPSPPFSFPTHTHPCTPQFPSFPPPSCSRVSVPCCRHMSCGSSSIHVQTAHRLCRPRCRSGRSLSVLALSLCLSSSWFAVVSCSSARLPRRRGPSSSGSTSPGRWSLSFVGIVIVVWVVVVVVEGFFDSCFLRPLRSGANVPVGCFVLGCGVCVVLAHAVVRCVGVVVVACMCLCSCLCSPDRSVVVCDGIRGGNCPCVVRVCGPTCRGVGLCICVVLCVVCVCELRQTPPLLPRRPILPPAARSSSDGPGCWSCACRIGVPSASSMSSSSAGFLLAFSDFVVCGGIVAVAASSHPFSCSACSSLLRSSVVLLQVLLFRGARLAPRHSARVILAVSPPIPGRATTYT